MAKGYLKNPVQEKAICQYCDKEFEYTRVSSMGFRKACLECIPDGCANDASLLRRLIKAKAVRIKGRKCEVCGLEDEPVVYDFHHKDPTQKDFHLGDKKSTVKMEAVLRELDKCVMVCSNCHRKIHHSENFDK